MKEAYKWHSVADGKFPVSDEKVLLNTTTFGTVIGYYDIEDKSFFLLSGAKPQILHDEVIAWTDIPECDINEKLFRIIGAIILAFSVLLLSAGLATVITCEQEKTAIGLLNKEIQVDTLAVTPQGKVFKVKLIREE